MAKKHGILAQFRVDRMTVIQDSNAPYTDAPQRMTLLCKNRTMRSVIDHFGEDVATEVVDAKHFQATVDVAPTPPFFFWVFTFGGAIRVEGLGRCWRK